MFSSAASYSTHAGSKPATARLVARTLCMHDDAWPWLTKLVGIGPVWPVTGQTGPVRFRFEPVGPNLKFKFKFKKNKKFSKKS